MDGPPLERRQIADDVVARLVDLLLRDVVFDGGRHRVGVAVFLVRRIALLPPVQLGRDDVLHEHAQLRLGLVGADGSRHAQVLHRGFFVAVCHPDLDAVVFCILCKRLCQRHHVNRADVVNDLVEGEARDGGERRICQLAAFRRLISLGQVLPVHVVLDDLHAVIAVDLGAIRQRDAADQLEKALQHVWVDRNHPVDAPAPVDLPHALRDVARALEVRVDAAIPRPNAVGALHEQGLFLVRDIRDPRLEDAAVEAVELAKLHLAVVQRHGAPRPHEPARRLNLDVVLRDDNVRALAIGAEHVGQVRSDLVEPATQRVERVDGIRRLLGDLVDLGNRALGHGVERGGALLDCRRDGAHRRRDLVERLHVDRAVAHHAVQAEIARLLGQGHERIAGKVVDRIADCPRVSDILPHHGQKPCDRPEWTVDFALYGSCLALDALCGLLCRSGIALGERRLERGHLGHGGTAVVHDTIRGIGEQTARYQHQDEHDGDHDCHNAPGMALAAMVPVPAVAAASRPSGRPMRVAVGRTAMAVVLAGTRAGARVRVPPCDPIVSLLDVVRRGQIV